MTTRFNPALFGRGCDNATARSRSPEFLDSVALLSVIAVTVTLLLPAGEERKPRSETVPAPKATPHDLPGTPAVSEEVIDATIDELALPLHARWEFADEMIPASARALEGKR